MGVLDGIRGPRDLDRLGNAELTALAAEIRQLLVETVARTSGHLGPNLGVVELTIALHRVFRSPEEPILFDVGHQAYVHKMLTGRAPLMPTLRQQGGLSGYPSRAESEHDWIENSHASPALSYADGLSKAFALRGEHRPVVAVVGDGALTGGMCWEALNNIAAGGRPVVIVVNDNGRSYAPTAGALTTALSALRLRPEYEQVLSTVKHGLPKLPVLGPLGYRMLHGAKKGVADVLAPQGLFRDLGIKYVGPIDGHDRVALETAFARAREYGGPVIVHCRTRKGCGYAPAESDELDHMHQSGGFDPLTGVALPSAGRRWTDVFADEIIGIGEQRPDVVAVSAAMCQPTGLHEFARRFPDRFFDVGIAEQHAITSAAGLATGGLHPVVAIYATFLNRAFDQILMDVALHRLPVTIVADRAGITGPDGPSHHGMWDLAMFGVVPGLRVAAPRDEPTLRDELNEAVGYADGPTVVRFPKTVLPEPMPAVGRVGGADILAEPDLAPAVDVLMVAVGAMAEHALAAAAQVSASGYRVRVVDPRWVVPVDPALVELARPAELVVTVEDGVALGGVGARIAQMLRAAGCTTPTYELGLPTQFLAAGTAAQVRTAAGLDVGTIAARILAALPRRSGRDLAPESDQYDGEAVVAQ